MHLSAGLAHLSLQGYQQLDKGYLGLKLLAYLSLQGYPQLDEGWLGLKLQTDRF
jgi:hypothetical protein